MGALISDDEVKPWWDTLPPVYVDEAGALSVCSRRTLRGWEYAVAVNAPPGGRRLLVLVRGGVVVEKEG